MLYRFYQAGVAVGEAGVNAETAPTTQFVTFAQTATSVAYANPSTTQSASVTITVYNAAAGVVAGELAFSSLASIFGHHAGGFFGGGSGFFGGESPVSPVSETITHPKIGPFVPLIYDLQSAREFGQQTRRRSAALWRP